MRKTKEKLTPEKRLRDSKGRFVSRAYQDEAERMQHFSNVGKDLPLQEWYNLDRSAERVLQGEPFRTAVAVQSSTLFIDMHNARGNIFLNDKIVSEGIAREKVIRFQQAVFTEMDCTGIAYRPKLDYTGNFYLEIPNRDEIEEMEYMTGEELIEFLENFGIDIWLSDPKKSTRAKEQHEKLIRNNTARLEKIKHDKQARKKASKSRTKPKGNK